MTHPAPPGGSAPWLATAPGWYPDPWRVAALRWWDGRSWSGYVATPPIARPPRVPRGPGISGGGIAGTGAAFGAIASLGVSVLLLVLYGNGALTSPWILLLTEVPLWAGFLGAAYLASHRNGSGSLQRDFDLAWPNGSEVRPGLLGGLVGRVIPVIYTVLVWEALRYSHVHNIASSVLGIRPEGTSTWVALILLTVVGAPVVEEIFFRGLIQGAFSRRVGPVPALFITAVIFSFSHVPGEGPFAPVLLFPAAVVLGYLRMKTGRLGAGIIAHAEFNAIGLLLVLLPIFR